VVVGLQINLTKLLGPLELLEKVVNLGNWVPIFECDFFHCLVINTDSPVLEYKRCVHFTIDNIQILSPNHRHKGHP
jgi:hypothetical protein